MTTNDPTYYARRHRLNTADEGATVTIPAGWTPPDDPLGLVDHRLRRALKPGDVLTNDGRGDTLPWRHDVAGCVYSSVLAYLGLDVDEDDAVAALDALPKGATLTFDEPRDFAPGAYRMGIPGNYRIAGLLHEGDGDWEARGVRVTGGDCKFWLPSSRLPALGVTAADFATSDSEEPTGDAPEVDKPEVDKPDDATGDTPPATTGCDCEYCEAVRRGGSTIGTVSVNVVPDTGDLKVTGDEPPQLDEYQLERVAALDEALRILEARRAPETSDKARSFGDVFAPTGRPMVKTGDLVTVAAFIADGTMAGGEKA